MKKNWKGADSSQIIIYTTGGSCMFPFAKGGEYLVFSSQRGTEDQLYTSSCSGTKPLARAETDISVLSHITKGNVPTKQVNLEGDMPNHSKISNTAIVAVVALFAIIIGVFVIRRMRKKMMNGIEKYQFSLW
ncbi:cobalamin biosynthesis protein CbiN [Bacillus gaemokensis]|uniref:cobalamin biosynthesis protein CbiN n=1 Tax=Bacillus gaemokensis TaxID=574375 RepID=UPI003899216E